MKCLIILFLAIVSATNLTAQNEDITKKEKSEIMQTVKDWNKAFAKNDVETYFSFIHDDVTLFIASSPYRIDGKTIDKEEFIWSLNKERTKVGFFQELQMKVKVLGETAIVTYHNRGAYGTDGQEKIIYLKETNILVKESGKWKIIHIHVSN